MASKGPIFRIFSANSRSKEEAVEKRREQVRRAQNVYRQRKTRYVKALELDVSSSRQRESRLSTEKAALENEVRMLLAVLDQHGIATPDASLLPVAHAVRRQTSSSLSQSQSPISATATTVESHPEWPRAATLTESPSPSAFALYSTGGAYMMSKVCDLDPTTLGMKFVLKIEEPCLGHVHGDPTRPDDPSGHALTATSQILCVSLPASSASPATPDRSSLLPVQDVPETILDRLLALAPGVAGGSDITPVQAWDELRRKPILGSLDLECVMRLAARLRDSAKCHGFGAVVDYTTFQNVVGEVISSRISFGII